MKQQFVDAKSGIDTQVLSTQPILPNRVLLIPLVFALALAAMASLPSLRSDPRVLATFLGAAGLLAVWDAALYLLSKRAGRGLTIEWAPKRQHYLQACAQGSVLIYWGFYWSQAPAYAPFIVAQLFFAYAFDLLLCWSRRTHCILGFAQFPVIFSINLFLWFKPDWFYLQFAMIALGFTAKEFIRWNRDGRRVHIFNPSSLPLAVFSLALLATGATGIAWGQEIATTQFYPPNIYLFLFLIGLPGQFFFGVTSMTMSAVVSAWAFGRIYFALTGIYFFYDSYIPIAVFLGMHLLFNDPATSPRTELGRIIFGSMYGLSTALLYDLLGRAGMPTFYDKLLQVPLMNLSVKGIDAMVRSRWLRRLDPARLGPSLTPYRRNLAYITVWALIFTSLSVSQGVGDWHPGQFLPFWQNACQADRPYACPYLADMQANYCDQGSGWACNEAGRLDIALSRSGEDLRRSDPGEAAGPWNLGCELGFEAACRNLRALRNGGAIAKAPPTLKDYPIILRGSKDRIRDTSPQALYTLGCREGWQNLCSAR